MIWAFLILIQVEQSYVCKKIAEVRLHVILGIGLVLYAFLLQNIVFSYGILYEPERVINVGTFYRFVLQMLPKIFSKPCIHILLRNSHAIFLSIIRVVTPYSPTQSSKYGCSTYYFHNKPLALLEGQIS